MANPIWQGSTGSGGNDWDVATNWSTGVVPQAGDTVTIPSGTVSSPNLSGSTVEIGSLTVASGGSVDLTGDLTVTGNLTDNGFVGLDYQQLVEFGGSTLTVDGTLTVANAFTVGNRFQTAPTTVVVGALANTGGIDIAGNATGVLAQIDVASAAGFGGMAGVLTGNIALGIGIAGAGDALLDFEGGGLISTIDGSVSLYGPTAFIASGNATSSNSALSGPLTIADGGALSLQGGASLGTGSLTADGGVGIDSPIESVGGSTLTVSGTLTATNGGAAFALGNEDQTAPTTVTASAVADTGGIEIGGNPGGTKQVPVLAQLDVASAAGFGGMPGVLTGNVTLGMGIGGGGGPGDALLDFQGGGEINTIENGTLALNGALAFIASGNATSSNSALAGPLTIAAGGGLLLQSGASVAIGPLTDAGSISVDTGFLAVGGSTLTVNGALTLTGNLDIGRSAMVTAGPTVTVTGSLANSGTISLDGDEQHGFQGVLDVGTAAGLGTAGVLSGNVNLTDFSLLDFQGGGLINTIAGSVSLYGPNAFIASGSATSSNSALTGPLTIAAGGGLILQGGVLVATQALTIAGNVAEDAAFLGVGGSSLTVNGVLTVSGSLTIGRNAMTVASAKVGASGGLANSGTITLNGDKTGGFQGILDVSAAAGFGTAGVLSGNVNLTGFSLLDFAGGLISSIDNTGHLLIDGPDAFLASGAATASNSALTSLASMDGFFTLADGAALTTNNGLSIGNGTNGSLLNVDAGFAAAGSFLQIGGTLTLNSFGGVSIGNNAMAAATTVTANALNFAGTTNSSIAISGGTPARSGTGQATLSVASAAGFGQAGVLSGGNLTLVGKTLLDFTLGGQITSIAFGANLTIDGSDAFVASGTATSSNSALTGLTNLGGALFLHDAASVMTAGNLTVGDGTHGTSAVVDSGATLTAAGTLSIVGSNDTLNVGSASASAAALSNAGGINIAGNQSVQGTLTVSGNASNTGAVAIGSGGVLNDGANAYDQAAGSTVVSGTLDAGVVDITGGTLELAVGGVVNGGISFAAVSSGEFKIDGTTMPGNTISGFTASGDAIDLTGLAFSGNTSVGFNSATDMLTVTEGGTSATLQLDAENYTGITWSAAQDAGTGTDITANPCYCRGTLILTEAGEAAVEDLASGDRVISISGAARPIKWIGRRSYSGRFAVGQKHILPVCIAAGALADGVPRRDLWVSPNHALYLEDVLIEARDLVNGVSIVQAERVDAIQYFHIELNGHDVIVAEGAPAESFIDDDSRSLFHNAHEYRALYPDERAGPARYCAPRRDQGYEVERARAAIDRRAGEVRARSTGRA
jgi:hypothetical protein